MGPIERILCPVDYSEAGHLGLDVAIDWAQRTRAELVVLHVIPPYLPQSMDFGAPISPDAPVEVQRRAEAQTHLDSFVEGHVPPGLKVRPVIRMGSPCSEIVQEADQEQSDLIIMSTHGFAGWRHLVMGSVTEGVVRTASCPVLTVGPNCLGVKAADAANTEVSPSGPSEDGSSPLV